MPTKLLYTFLFCFVILTAQGNVLAVYEHKHAEGESGTFTLAEQHLYGASRIGMTKPNLALNTTTQEAPVPTILYELTNHLGNVMAVITDEPTDAETPTVESLADYYPFGMTMPGRSYNAHTLRHGFTGHEKESDLSEGIYTTEFRLYDARVGRWLSVDPLFEKYVGMSPYNYCMLNPVMMVDPDGRETYIGVETKGTGHTFIVVSNESCYSVYTYGRYGKADAITLGATGEGVLIKYQGNDAREYILTELYRMEANIYQINDANDDLVKKYFDSKFDISTKQPDSSSPKIKENGRVVDTYSLFGNNCTTTSCDAVKYSGSSIFDVEGLFFDYDEDFTIPSSLNNYLNFKSENNDKNVINITESLKNVFPNFDDNLPLKSAGSLGTSSGCFGDFSGSFVNSSFFNSSSSGNGSGSFGFGSESSSSQDFDR